MKIVAIIAFLLLVVSLSYAEGPLSLPGHQPFNPNALGNPNVGGNPFTFNDANPPYGTGGNPSSKGGTLMPGSADSPLTQFDQTGAYRGVLTPPRADVDSMGNTYGQYGDRHSLDSLNSMRGSDHPLSPFGHGWRIQGSH